MKNIIKAIIVCIFAVIFSAPAFAESYAHTIEYLMFEGYEYYGISATVTTNIDTEDGMTLYVAIYTQDGQMLEVSSTPLKQNEAEESIVYNLKVSTTLDETMTVKGMIWKDMKPYAKSISVKYNKKYNSGQALVVPDNKIDGEIKIPIDNVILEPSIDDNSKDESSIPNDWEIYVPSGNEQIYEDPNYTFYPPSTNSEYEIYLDEHGRIISSEKS